MSPVERYQRREAIRAVARKVNNRLRTKRARALARARGMCSRCAAHPARPGFASCEGCAQTQRSYITMRRADERKAVA